jgi:hypothetical protein
MNATEDQAVLGRLLIDEMKASGDVHPTLADLLDDLAGAGLMLKQCDETTGNPASDAYTQLIDAAVRP